MPYFSRLAVFVAATLALAGCGIASGDERITLRVLAASSLTDAFGELGAAYRSANRHVTSVQFEFAGSQEVAGDVADREQADVLATADEMSMDIATEHVTDRQAFAHGSMTIAVAPDNPHRIRQVADLADPRLRVVLGGRWGAMRYRCSPRRVSPYGRSQRRPTRVRCSRGCVRARRTRASCT
jgi:molybdate transport system substrate-binding protein